MYPQDQKLMNKITYKPNSNELSETYGREATSANMTCNYSAFHNFIITN